MEQNLGLLRDLGCQLPSRGDGEDSDILWLGISAAHHFDGREAKSDRLAGPRFRARQDVVASQGDRESGGLNRGGVRVAEDLMARRQGY